MAAASEPVAHWCSMLVFGLASALRQARQEQIRPNRPSQQISCISSRAGPPRHFSDRSCPTVALFSADCARPLVLSLINSIMNLFSKSTVITAINVQIGTKIASAERRRDAAWPHCAHSQRARRAQRDAIANILGLAKSTVSMTLTESAQVRRGGRRRRARRNGRNAGAGRPATAVMLNPWPAPASACRSGSSTCS